MKIGFYYWLRVAIMAVGFVVVVLMIRKFDQTQSLSADNINLCVTRIKALTMVDGFAVVQDGLDWYRRAGQHMEELDPIAVEKWFGANCRIKVKPAEATEASQAFLTVSFVSGEPQTLAKVGPGVYSWMGQVFTSPEFEAAIKSLAELPIRVRPGR